MKKLNQRGTIILLFIITFPFLVLLALYYMSESLTSYQVARFDQLHTEAQTAADAGADYSVEQLAQNSSWTGTTSDITLHSDSQLKTTFSASVSGNSSSKTIAVTGKTYWPSSATTPIRTVSIDVDLYPVTTGNYSIVAGAGGLIMSQSAKITAGNVFINGGITMSQNAQIGLSTNPVTVQVADQICPTSSPYTNYPQVCTSGNPISISNNAHIYGSVTATNQTNGSGMSNTGLVAGGSVAPQTLPTYDRASQKTAATNNMTNTQASCSGKGSSVTWPANTKITGNVSLSNQCSATVQGNVWITGNLSIATGATLTVDNSLGSTRPNIMIDGSSGLTISQASAVNPNSSGTGVEFYTFYSTASCSPDCTSVTGSDLVNSRTVPTITLSQSASAPSSIFYAYWSQASLSQGGQLGAVIGQTISMSQSSAITFGTPVNGVGNTTWIIKGYRRQF